jgi:hypothetical protein
MATVNQEYIDTVKNAQATMKAIQSELGALALVELRKEALLAAYKAEEQKIQETSTKIREEYGDGSLDLESGEFTPAETAEVVEE